MADDKPVIIIKKGGGHGGHHGGAWKVAYADFVTAMMAFFMVMWLLNTVDSATKKNIAHYFNNPGVFSQGGGSPMFSGGQGILPDQYVAAHPEQTNYNYGRSQDDRAGVTDSEGGKKDTMRYQESPGVKQAAQGVDPTRNMEAVEPGKSSTAAQATTAPASFTPIPELEALKREAAEGSKSGAEAGTTAGENSGSPATGTGSGAESIGSQGGTDTGRGAQAAGAAMGLTSQQNALEAVAEKIREQIATSPELQELIGAVDVKVDADGLNIEIMDTQKSSMFTSGSARVLPEARTAFAKLAAIINPLPNRIDLVGHTDAKPFGSGPGGYSNWELSVDRANAARRLLEAEGIPAARFTSVIGRADQELRRPETPYDPSNRRITLRMRFNLSTTVNIAKDPEALKKLDVEQQAFSKREEEKVHSLSAKQVLNPEPSAVPTAAPRKPGEPVKLPEDSATINPPIMPADKIFGNSPVIGPTALFE
jgi:chemotaxis protein MotB